MTAHHAGKAGHMSSSGRVRAGAKSSDMAPGSGGWGNASPHLLPRHPRATQGDGVGPVGC